MNEDRTHNFPRTTYAHFGKRGVANIAFFDATPVWSGGANRILFLAKELSRSGSKILIICLPGSKLSEESKKNELEVINIKPYSDIGLFSFFRVLSALKKYKIDIVDINSPKFYWIGVYAAKILGIKVILTRNVPYRKKGLKRFLNKIFLYSHCNTVISLSNRIKTELENDYKIKNVVLIYDGLFSEVKKITNDEILDIRKQYGIRENDIVFSMIGRIEENKGQIICVDAISDVCKIYKNIKLLIVGFGDANYTAKLKARIEEKKLDNIVILTGFVDNISKIFNVIDVLIQPSLYENIPITVLEACGLEKPVVGSNVGGIPEIIKNGINGYLFSAGDSRSLYESIIKLLKSNRKSMGKNGFEIVKEKFSKEKMLENYQKLLNDILKGMN